DGLRIVVFVVSEHEGPLRGSQVMVRLRGCGRCLLVLTRALSLIDRLRSPSAALNHCSRESIVACSDQWGVPATQRSIAYGAPIYVPFIMCRFLNCFDPSASLPARQRKAGRRPT